MFLNNVNFGSGLSGSFNSGKLFCVDQPGPSVGSDNYDTELWSTGIPTKSVLREGH